MWIPPTLPNHTCENAPAIYRAPLTPSEACVGLRGSREEQTLDLMTDVTTAVPTAVVVVDYRSSADIQAVHRIVFDGLFFLFARFAR